MTSKNDIWVERVLSSTEGMRPAEAPPFLLTRIEARLADAMPFVPKSNIRFALVGAVLLVVVNVGTLLLSSSDAMTNSPATGSRATITSYQSGDLSLDSFNGGSY